MTTGADRDKAIAALQAWTKAHDTAHKANPLHKHDAPPVPPVPPPPPAPVPGIPVIPATFGKLFRWVPAENGNTLGPLQILTYPDDHIGQPGQDMTVFNRFRHTRKPTVHDGYLDLRATRRPDGLFDADLVGTSEGGNGPTFGHGTFRAWLRFSTEPCHWNCSWLYDTTRWTATEIDAPEMLEGKSMALVVLGQGAGKRYGLPKPADISTAFHEYRLTRNADAVQLYIDGTTVATITGSMPADPLAILLDSKMGYPWAEKPDASTKDAFLHCAGICVDP